MDILLCYICINAANVLCLKQGIMSAIHYLLQLRGMSCVHTARKYFTEFLSSINNL